MSTGQTISVDGTIIVIRGFKAGKRLKASGIGKPMYSATLGGWVVDRHRLEDLLAWFESRNIAVTVIDPDRAQLDLGVPGDAA